MLKFLGNLDDRPTLGLILQPENVSRMLNGSPVRIDLEPLNGMDLVLLIAGAHTDRQFDYLAKVLVDKARATGAKIIPTED